ncbi:MAG: hypothetical protein AB7I27_01870 [Bacteriovoracaceae bacterium]
MKTKVIKLTKFQLSKIRENFESLKCCKNFYYVYESQTPNFVCVLLEGEMHVIKKRKKIEVINSGNLIGLENLLKNKKFKSDIWVSPNSVLVLLGKTEIIQALKEKQCKLYHLIKEVFGEL